MATAPGADAVARLRQQFEAKRFTMSTDRIEVLTQRLGARLAEHGISVDIIIVGGAAVALDANPERAGTVDIDVFCTNREHVDSVAAEIAQQEGLPSAWLNSDAQQFMSSTARHDDLPMLFEDDTVTIRRLDNRSLLAMKLRAGRLSKDQGDIERLIRTLGITSIAEAARVVDDYYDGEEQMKPVAKAVLEQLFDQNA